LNVLRYIGLEEGLLPKKVLTDCGGMMLWIVITVRKDEVYARAVYVRTPRAPPAQPHLVEREWIG